MYSRLANIVVWLFLSVHDSFTNPVISGLPVPVRISRGLAAYDKVSTKKKKRTKYSERKDFTKQTKSDPTSPKPKDDDPLIVGQYERCDQISTCATSFQELQQAILDADSGDVIGICGNIAVDSTPIQVQQTDVTLVGCCCKSKCVIHGSGSNTPNLVVTEGDFSLLNVIVKDGQCGSSNFSQGGGGNLQYLSTVEGSLLVVDCEFLNGLCDKQGGGNVDVSTAGSVTFRRTTFKNGSTASSYSGGGAFVTESTDITVDDCHFDGNTGTGFGFYYGSDPSLFYQAIIKDSVFSNNVGGPAGGIFYSDFGAMQRLEVLGTEFISNTATDVQGAGAAQISQNVRPDFDTLFWDGNFGSGNSGRLCQDLSYWNQQCFALDETFPLTS
jgi:hypothetical protein